MINDEFMSTFPMARAEFMPYMVSDHSPVVIKLLSSTERRKKAFRFSNFIAEKEEFLSTVASEWNCNVQGFEMYKLVTKIKNLKGHLKKLSRNNGNLHERVENKREKLRAAQILVDANPHYAEVKIQETIA